MTNDLGIESTTIKNEIIFFSNSPYSMTLKQEMYSAKKVMKYLQRTKSFMLVYKIVDNLELLRYTDVD